MQKITSLILLLCLNLGIAQQVYTTGDVKLNGKFTARIDMTTENVILTTIAPENVWYSVAFGVNSMDKDGDTFLSNGDNAIDAICSAYTTPYKDTQQDWTLVSNNTNNGKRTMVVTRPLKTTDKTDFVFNPKASSLTLMWAVGNTKTYRRHSRGNYGVTVAGVTLSNNRFHDEQFQISPNPVNHSFKLILPENLGQTQITMFNMLGKKMYQSVISETTSVISITDWRKGVYLIKIDATNGYSVIKKVIKK